MDKNRPQEIEKDILFGHEDIKHSTTTVRPVDGSKYIQSCVSMPVKIEDEDQTRTVRPVGGQESTLVEELDIDFRVPGLSHAVVKEAEHFRVRELVKKIESHLHREKHFKPTCSRITPTTHSATIRRR